MSEESQQFPREELEKLSIIYGHNILSEEFAKAMDDVDKLARFRKMFCFPKKKYDNDAKNKEKIGDENEEEIIYLCGHSLGLKPRNADLNVSKVLQNWSDRAVNSHFEGYLPAATCEGYCKDIMSKLVGASNDEISIMNGLTVNLHLLMIAFYRPTSKRNKILIEDHAFPSDRYAAASQIAFHGFDPKENLITLKPRENEFCLREEDVLKTIEEKGDEIALILWPGVQFYTGQLFNMETITKAAHSKGCKIGFDLAHAVGNVKLKLDEWAPDFAVWCTYKYLNSGAGSIGAIFVNSKHTQEDNAIPFLKGWWGNRIDSKFAMAEEFDSCVGADRFKLSNQSPVLCAMLMSSLEIFEEATIDELIKKQFLLTGYLEYLLKEKTPHVDIMTPTDPTQRGNQLSLYLKDSNVHHAIEQLEKSGVMCDGRPPSVIRLAPTPLYTSYLDVYKFVEILSSLAK